MVNAGWRKESRAKGFVLAGGRSSRMGADKALLTFRGRRMLEIALGTLREVCEEVAISGNREDLAAWAPVVPEWRSEAGPAAGIEAALAGAQQGSVPELSGADLSGADLSGVTVHPWVLMLPVDLPMITAALLRRWMSKVLSEERVRASYLECGGEWHPALCLVHRECLPVFQAALDAGDRKLTRIFEALGDRLLVVDASALVPDAGRCFVNVNTPEELAAAEAGAADDLA